MTNFFGGGVATETVNGFLCKKHKVTIEATARSKKKTQRKFDFSYADYFAGAEAYGPG